MRCVVLYACRVAGTAHSEMIVPSTLFAVRPEREDRPPPDRPSRSPALIENAAFTRGSIGQALSGLEGEGGRGGDSWTQMSQAPAAGTSSAAWPRTRSSRSSTGFAKTRLTCASPAGVSSISRPHRERHRDLVASCTIWETSNGCHGFTSAARQTAGADSRDGE